MPNKFTPINPTASQSAVINQINRNFSSLDSEANLKQYKDRDGNRMLSGAVSNDTFGTVFYDNQGRLLMIQGKLPDGNIGTLYYFEGVPHIYITANRGMVVSRQGVDVLTLI